MDLCMECEDEELDPWQMPEEPEPSPPKPTAQPPPPPYPVAPQPPPLTPAVQQTATIAQQSNVLPRPPPLTPSPAVQHMVSPPIYQQPSQAKPVTVSTVSQKAVGQVSQPAVQIVTQNSSASQTTKPILINLMPQGTSQPTYLMPATQPGGQSYYLMPLNVTGVPTLQTVSNSGPVMLQQVPSVVQPPPNVTIVPQMPQIIQMSQPAPVPTPAPPTTNIVHVIQNTTSSSAATQLKTFAQQANNPVAKPLYKLVTTSQAPSENAQVAQQVANPVQAATSTASATIHHRGPIVRPNQISQAKPAMTAQTQVHPVKITQAQANPVAAATSKVGQVSQAQNKPAVATPGQVQARQGAQSQTSTNQATSAKTSTSAPPTGTVMSAPSTVPKRRKKGLPPPRVVAKILQDKTVVYVKCTESSSSTHNTTTLTQSKPSDNAQPVTVNSTAKVTPTPILPRPVAVHQALQSPSPMAIVNTTSSATKVTSLTYTCPLCNNKFFSLATLTAHRQHCNKNTPAVTQSVAPPRHNQPPAVESPLPTPRASPTSAPSKTPSPPKSIQLNITIEEYYYGTKEPNVSPDNTEEKGQCVFKCYTCSKVLKSNIKYMNHIRHHIEHERQQNPDISDVTSCQRCFKRFETPFQLQCHLETMHNTANPDTFCKICEISFKSEKALQSHMLNEHQPREMPYACKLCGFRSSVLSDVESHFRRTHEGTKNLLCTFCLKIIVQCRAFDVHCLKHFRKSDKKKCKSCRLQFHSASELQQHRKHDHVSFAPAHVIKQHKENAKLNFTFHKKANKIQDVSPVGTSGSVGVTEYGVAGMPRGIKRSLNLTCRPVQDNRTHTCLECGAKVQDLSSHYMKYVSCSKCRYSTCCSRAYADHMICRHQAQGRQRVVSASMFQVNMYTCETGMKLSCGCSYTTTGGREMAEHLQACYFKSCHIMSSPLKINVQSLTGFGRNRQNAGGIPPAKRQRSDLPGNGVEFVDLTEEDEEDDMVPGSFVCPHCDLHFNLRMPLTQHIKFCGPQQGHGEEDAYTVSIKQEPEDPIVVVEDNEEEYVNVDDEDDLKFMTLQDDTTAENEDSPQQSDSEERDEQKEWEASIGLDVPDINSLNTVAEHSLAESASTAEGTSEGGHVGIVIKVEKEEVDSVMDLQPPEELLTAEESGTATDDASGTEITIKVEREEVDSAMDMQTPEELRTAEESGTATDGTSKGENPEGNVDGETDDNEFVPKEFAVDIVQDVAKEPELDEEVAEEIQPATDLEPSIDTGDTAPEKEQETVQDGGETFNSDVAEQGDNQNYPGVETDLEPSVDIGDTALEEEQETVQDGGETFNSDVEEQGDNRGSSGVETNCKPSLDTGDNAPEEEQETVQDGDETINSDVAEAAEQEDNQDYSGVETDTVLDDVLVSDDQEHVETIAIKAVEDTSEECHVEELGFTESTLEKPSTEESS
ncbi:uncharacterized protein LOC144862503 isoform X2 [Branchiostoma floridae x Branchiostoma japonicum]